MVFREPHTPGSKTPGGGRRTTMETGPRHSFAPTSSSVGMRRSSSVFGAAALHGTTAFKDKRNLQNPATKQAMVARITNFLNGEVSYEKVKSPTRKDFLDMFSYIYATFDEQFSLHNKTADEQDAEVIKVFRNLGYPVAIKNSTLKSLGAPNSWPHLLGALNWMIELTEFFSKITLEYVMNEETPDMLIRYQSDAATSKRYFDSVKDTTSESEKNELANGLIRAEVAKFSVHLEGHYDTDTKLQESNLRIKSLEEEIAALEDDKQNDRCPLLEQEIKTIDTDIKSLEIWLAEVKKNEDNIRRESENERRLIDEVDIKTLKINAEIKAKQRQIEEQTERTGLDSAAIRALAMEKESLSGQLKTITNDLEILSKFRYNIAPKATTAFMQEQARYRRLLQRVYGVRATYLGDATAPLIDSLPGDIRSLIESLSTDVRRLFSRTKTELESRLLDVEASARRLVEDDRRLNDEEMRVDKETRAEEVAMEKEDRHRSTEREEWERESNLRERDNQAAEVEKDAILGSQKEIGQLRAQIHEAELDMEEAKRKCIAKKAEFDTKLETLVEEAVVKIEVFQERCQFIENEMNTLEKFNIERRPTRK